jgi:hypothetical protein
MSVVLFLPPWELWGRSFSESIPRDRRHLFRNTLVAVMTGASTGSDLMLSNSYK